MAISGEQPGESMEETGTSNELYNLVSVLYHTLQGLETCGRYLRDAEQAGDEELVDFFKRVQEADHRLSEDAKRLLRERIESMGAGEGEGPRGAGPVRRGGALAVKADAEDTVNEASEESFPASDAPAY